MVNKYIEFQPNIQTNKTLIWSVLNRKSKDVIGHIKWYPQWRQYCFFTEPDIVLSMSCLREIIKFTEDHKDDRVGV